VPWRAEHRDQYRHQRADKTTMMLELARELLQRANADSQHPIPVVLTLSSWAVRREPLGDWIVRELTARYKISTAQARLWLNTDQLIPLLDGLDEVAEEHQQACVTSINDFRAERGITHIVVCCRTTDYERLRDPLRTYGTLTIQPLTRKQVEDFLARAGEPVAAVRAAIAADSLLARGTHPVTIVAQHRCAGLPARRNRHGGHG
jgi:predicted NACHT family NTPase